MRDFDKRDTVVWRDGGDWGGAIVVLLLGLAFATASWATFRDNGEAIARQIALPLSVLLFAISVFLFFWFLRAKSRRIEFNRRTGALNITFTAPWSREVLTASIEDVAELIFWTTENDGFWYHAVVRLLSGRDVVIAQGANRDIVYDRLNDMQREFARHRRLEITQRFGNSI